MVNKYQDKYLEESDVNDINKYLRKLNFKLVNVEEDYYNLVKLGNNSLYGNERVILREYSLEELFDSYMYDELKNSILGEDEDDYFLTTDDVVNYVLYQNEEENTNYDGIVIDDILDSKNAFVDNGMDIITIKSSNQIKLIDNLNPTSSKNINESISSIRDKLINLATSQGFNHSYIEGGWYEDFGNGKRVPDTYWEDNDELSDDWFIQPNVDRFSLGRSFVRVSILENRQILYILNINSMGENKGKITKLIKAFIENLSSSWIFAIVDNENQKYWNYIKSLYPKTKFDDIDYDNVIDDYLLG